MKVFSEALSTIIVAVKLGTKELDQATRAAMLGTAEKYLGIADEAAESKVLGAFLSMLAEKAYDQAIGEEGESDEDCLESLCQTLFSTFMAGLQVGVEMEKQPLDAPASAPSAPKYEYATSEVLVVQAKLIARQAEIIDELRVDLAEFSVLCVAKDATIRELREAGNTK